MQCNLIRIPCEYKDEKGKTHLSNDYYIVFPNGETIAILPKWAVVGSQKRTGEFDRLRALSDKVER